MSKRPNYQIINETTITCKPVNYRLDLAHKYYEYFTNTIKFF